MNLADLIAKFNGTKKPAKVGVIYCAKGEEAMIRRQWAFTGKRMIVIEDGTPADQVEALLKTP